MFSPTRGGGETVFWRGTPRQRSSSTRRKFTTWREIGAAAAVFSPLPSFFFRLLAGTVARGRSRKTFPSWNRHGPLQPIPFLESPPPANGAAPFVPWLQRRRDARKRARTTVWSGGATGSALPEKGWLGSVILLQARIRGAQRHEHGAGLWWSRGSNWAERSTTPAITKNLGRARSPRCRESRQQKPTATPFRTHAVTMEFGA